MSRPSIDRSSGLYFDIDADAILRVAGEIQATEKQVKFALSAALKRTAATLRTLAARGLKNELQLRTISLLRKRLKTLKLRAYRDGVTLWFGLNDMPASWFKGTPRQTPTGAVVRGYEIKGGFVAKSKINGRLTVFKRAGRARLHIDEQNIPIGDKAITFVEDEIFSQTEDIFWKYFTRDLQARVKYSIGER